MSFLPFYQLNIKLPRILAVDVLFAVFDNHTLVVLINLNTLKIVHRSVLVVSNSDILNTAGRTNNFNIIDVATVGVINLDVGRSGISRHYPFLLLIFLRSSDSIAVLIKQFSALSTGTYIKLNTTCFSSLVRFNTHLDCRSCGYIGDDEVIFLT